MQHDVIVVISCVTDRYLPQQYIIMHTIKRPFSAHGNYRLIIQCHNNNITYNYNVILILCIIVMPSGTRRCIINY